MPVEKLITRSPSETFSWAESFAQHLKPGDVMALTGELGAGKTVIAKGIGKGLGVREEILSPTFNYVLEYSGRLPFFHADCYRITSPDHFIRLGLEEYFDQSGVFLLEWAERIRSLIPRDAILILLSPCATSDERLIEISRP